MDQLINEYNNNPLGFTGFIIFTIGLLLFAFGRKFFLFRWMLGDRSMFWQFLWGGVIMIIGFGILWLNR